MLSKNITLTCVFLEIFITKTYLFVYIIIFIIILFHVLSADYAAVATISTRKETETYPIANVISISDGPIGNGSGIPYMYITPNGLAHIAQDLEVSKHHTHIM